VPGRFLSQGENYLAVLDLSSGAARTLYPTPGPGARDAKIRLSGAAFSADGRRVLFGTDGGGEQALVLSIEVATGKETARYVETRPTTAAIADLAVARRGNLVAVMLDAGNHEDLRLLDATTLKPRAPVALPLGDVSGGTFSEDGKRFTLRWSTPSVPADIYVVDTATGKLAPLRNDPRPQLAGLPAVEASIAEVEAFDHVKIPIGWSCSAAATGATPCWSRSRGCRRCGAPASICSASRASRPSWRRRAA
jgi:dipeptidyl aminopeptidase/acylaminoacyl peptidase